jgi:hypothetical protein
MAAGATYEPIQTQTLGSNQPSVTFSSIPQTYTDLVLVCSMQSTAATDRIAIKFNSGSGNDYTWTRITGDGTNAGSSKYNNQASAEIADYTPQSGSSYLISNTNICNYSNSSTPKVYLTRYGITSNYVAGVIGSWFNNTAAITTITIVPTSGGANLISGSTFTLYGILAA